MRAGAPGSRDFARHVVGIGQPLVVEMAAFLRQHLILDLHGRSAGVLQFTYQAHGVQSFAISGVAVHQNRQAGGANQLASRLTQFFQRDDAEVGQGHRSTERRAGKVQRLEAGALREAGRQGIVRARHADDARSVQ